MQGDRLNFCFWLIFIQIKKKSVCLRPHDRQRSENFYDVRNQE
jgi:hypothetical protein